MWSPYGFYTRNHTYGLGYIADIWVQGRMFVSPESFLGRDGYSMQTFMRVLASPRVHSWQPLYIYMYTYIYIHVYMYVCICAYSYIYMYIFSYLYLCTHSYHSPNKMHPVQQVLAALKGLCSSQLPRAVHFIVYT